MSGIPNAEIKVAKEHFLLLSIESNTLSTDFFPNPDKFSHSFR